MRSAGGPAHDLDESPLTRLASPSGGQPAFLAPHQVEAGERVRGLFERARLRPRVTMAYDRTRTAGRGARNAAPVELSDMACDARRMLAAAEAALPEDCAGVVIDVCGFLKGLQTVERERGWPRRSAKLVLRIGLEHLARHFGLSAVATGDETRRPRRWLGPGARPTEFG